jgi:hypothetical protein
MNSALTLALSCALFFFQVAGNIPVMGNAAAVGKTYNGGAVGGAVTRQYFGQSLNTMSHGWPNGSFGVARSWDAGDGISWQQIEIASGSYTWTKFDAYVSAAKAHGQTVLYTFGRTPCWANPSVCYVGAPAASPACNYSAHACQPPDDVSTTGTGTDAAFSGFVTALVAHIVAQGWQSTVTQFEVWNEVNNGPFWQGSNQQLARMTSDLEAGVHASLSSAQILSPSTCNCSGSPHLSGYNSTAMNTLLAASYGGSAIWQKVGAVAFHPYLGANYPENVGTILSGYNAMSNLHGLPLINTEGSWGPNQYASLGINPGSTVCSSTNMAANVASGACMGDMVAFTARSLIYQASKGVAGYDWYQWDNTSSQGGGTLWYSGGTTAAGTAYNSVYHWLVGSAIAPCTNSGAVYTCLLTMPAGNSGKIMWTQSSTSTTTTMPWTGHKLTLDGASAAASSGATVPVTQQPVLMQNF